MIDPDTLSEQISELPALPEVYIKASKLLDDKHATAEKIGEVIQTDPAITARILKMINSAYFGLRQPVYSISQSISLLGNQRLKHILFGAVLGGVFKDISSDNFSMEDFWKHSVKTAIIARHMGMQNARVTDHDALFTAGLLHDIGRLVIASLAPVQLAEITDLSHSQGLDILDAETRILGLTHTDVGEALLLNWGLPQLLINCVKYHHQTSHEGPTAIPSSIIYLSNQLSQFEAPVDEEETETMLDKIENWPQSGCSREQIRIGSLLAENQLDEVLDSLGLLDY